MAITVGTAGAWAYAASGSVTPTLPTHAAGDMLLVRVAYKSSAVATCAASTATSGWAKVGEFVGSTNSGNGTGSVNMAVFWKEAASSSETNPTITFSQTVTQVGHVAVSYQKGASETWVTPYKGSGVGGAAFTSTTSVFTSPGTWTGDPTVTGDLIDVFIAASDDTAITFPTVSQTSVTFSAQTDYPTTAGIDTSGADGAYDGGYRIATAGTATGNPNIAATLSTSETGSVFATRLRVIAAGNITVTPTTAALVITKNIPTITVSDNQLVTPTTKALTATAFAPTVSTPELATPTTVSLVLSAFAPTISFTDNQLVTPTTAALVLAAFAPVITAPEPQLVTPTTATLTLTANAPTVTASDHQTATPTTAALTATKYAPAVSRDAYSAVVRADGPTVYLRFGEPSGLIAKDEIGNAFADLYNTPTLAASGLILTNSDTAISFARASSEYAYVDTRMPAGSSAGVTIEAWVKFATVTAATIYPVTRWFQVSPVAESQFYYHVSGNALRYLYQDATGFRNTFSDAWTPTVGTTYHLVVTHDHAAEVVKFYVNGTLLSSEDVSAFGVPVVHGANTWMTVGRAGSDYFDGTQDEVAVYNAVLSPTRILAHYAAATAVNVSVTPTTAALLATTFAPTITFTDHQLVTPTTKTAVLATFAPTVTAPDHQLVTPGNATVTLATFAPTVSAADHQTATPTTATLTTASFAPAVSISDHQAVTPTTTALTLTTNAPTVTTPILATPTTASLVTTSNAPTVSTPELVTPTTKALSLSTFAPTITNPQTYVPDTAIVVLTKYAPIVDVTAASTIVVPNATLTITENAPTVTANQHVSVVPDTATLITSPQVPTVAASDHQSVTPTTAVLVATKFAPTVTTSDQQAVVPTTKALTLVTFAPTVSTTAHVAVIPSTKVLQLNAFAPTTRVANYAIPTMASLTLSVFAPLVSATQNAYLEIVPNVLTLTEFAPFIAITGHADIVPLTAELHLALFPPTAEQHSITPLPINIYGFAVVAMGGSSTVERQNGGATVRSEGGSTAVSSSGPSARVTIR